MDATTPISALRKPTLARLISESLADQRIIKSAEEQARRGSERALQAWFRQSLRLDIAHTEHGLRNERFIDFARKLGVDKSSAYLLRHLHRYEAQITERCLDEAESAAKRAEPFYYPGWLTALGWFHKFGRNAKFGGHTLNRRWNNDEKTTPPHIAKRYAAHCTLDVAASDENHVCPKWFTKKQNGLKQKWLGTVWMNPPYSNLAPWCIKAVEHAESGGTVIALLPAWTDAKWFHDYVSLGKVTYLRNRLKFGGAENHAPFASIIVVWTRETVQAARLRQGMGDFSVFGGLERQSPYEFRHPQATRYIITPPVVYQRLDAEHHFDFDPFPYPRPAGYDGLQVPWGKMNYVNAPFSRGLTACIRKGIEEQQRGNSSLFVVPADPYLQLLLEAGAELRSLGRVPFLDPETGASSPRPLFCIAALLRGHGTHKVE